MNDEGEDSRVDTALAIEWLYSVSLRICDKYRLGVIEWPTRAGSTGEMRREGSKI